MSAADIVHIYCDGSCYPNPGPAAWAFSAYEPDGAEIHFESGALPHATNNTAEMAAMLHSLQWASQWPAKIHTDSMYVVNGITKWMHGWARNNWVRKEKGKPGMQPIPNAELWKLMLNTWCKHHEIVWVRGHAGIRGNERVDFLAGQARIEFMKNSLKEGIHVAA